MHLISRAPRAQDLDVCARITQDSFTYDHATRTELVKMWSKLLLNGSALANVIENPARALDSCIVGFGFGVFVSDDFAEEATTSLPPYIGKQVLLKWTNGQSPILAPSEIQKANSGDGLNWLGLGMSWGETCVSPQEQFHVSNKMMESLFEAIRGYQLKQFLKEVYGEENRQKFMAFGAHLKNDHREFWAGQNSVPQAQRPYLMGVTREEAFSPCRDGTHVCALFAYTPPRFYFSAVEQELLQHALCGETDIELAKVLHRSPHTVKTQWLTIYERVAAVDTRFFSPTSNDSSKRGQEKRRVLLNYLRLHPEELRLHERPKKELKRKIHSFRG